MKTRLIRLDRRSCAIGIALDLIDRELLIGLIWFGIEVTW